MKKLTSFHLKIIAITTMVIDHAFKIFTNDIFSWMQSQQLFTIPNYILFMFILAIGRIAFPLFAYMIAEGCYYTRNIKKYILRLCLLGIVSEIPFQYMIAILNNQAYSFSFSLGNVFFTLALGASAIEAYRYLKEKSNNLIFLSLPVILCSVIAQILNTDYSAPGVLLIFFCYCFRETKYWYRPILIFNLFLYALYMPFLGIMNFGLDWIVILEAIFSISFSCLSLFVIKQYNHQRGKAVKWLFYVFYPLHIAVLVGLYYVTHL